MNTNIRQQIKCKWMVQFCGTIIFSPIFYIQNFFRSSMLIFYNLGKYARSIHILLLLNLSTKCWKKKRKKKDLTEISKLVQFGEQQSPWNYERITMVAVTVDIQILWSRHLHVWAEAIKSSKCNSSFLNDIVPAFLFLF